MRITYDSKVDALYIRFIETTVTTENVAEGVAFDYDYGFPHVIKALEPDGELRFSWDEIKRFIKPGSLLAKHVR